MAGIGFELRRLLGRRTFFDYLRAYGFAGLISSGPWVLSIASVLLVGVLCADRVEPRGDVVAFLVSVTYLMAASLVATGPLQLMFSRYVADRVYEHATEAILPNLLGALLVTTLGGGLLATSLAFALFPGRPAVPALLVPAFVTLCDGWLLVVLLSGLKQYRAVLWTFLASNVLVVAGAFALHRFGLPGLLAGFTFGQAVMLFAMLALVVRAHPAKRLVSFDFLRPDRAFYDLALVGLLYNLGIWADKFIFWMRPETSEQVLGPLRSSVLYDLPIFLAYLSIVPGMSVFLMRLETDFAECYELFFRTIREGGTLDDIHARRDEMTRSVRDGLYGIFKVQGLTVLVIVLTGPALLRVFGISRLYVNLLYVDVVAVGIQVLLLAILSVLFYLDRRGSALAVTALFLGGNVGFTLLSQALGPKFYGFGFAVAAALASIVGLVLLGSCLDQLEFRTFMARRRAGGRVRTTE